MDNPPELIPQNAVTFSAVTTIIGVTGGAAKRASTMTLITPTTSKTVLSLVSMNLQEVSLRNSTIG